MRVRFYTHCSKFDDNDVNVIFLIFFRSFVIIMKHLINNVRVIVDASLTHLRNVIDFCFLKRFEFFRFCRIKEYREQIFFRFEERERK